MSKRDSLTALFCSVLLVGLLALSALAVSWLGYPIPMPTLVEDVEPTSPAWEQARGHIDEADRLTELALEQRMRDLSDWFEQRGKNGSEAFAADSLSIWGKWSMVKSKITMDDSHALFLSRKFDEHLFSPDALRGQLQNVIAGFTTDLDVIENALLLRLMADVAESGLPRGRAEQWKSDELLRKAVARIAKQIAPQLDIDLGVSIGSLLATSVGPANALSNYVAGIVVRLAGAVAGRLWISTTFYGVGMVSGVASLGVAAAVTVILDRIITEILFACGYDPQKDIANKIRASLKQTSERMIDGQKEAQEDYRKLLVMAKKDGSASVREASALAVSRIEKGDRLGLRWELDKARRDRSRLLKRTLHELLTTPAEGGNP